MNTDKVVSAVGSDTIDECVRALLDTVTGGDLFDCAAGDLCEARGVDYGFPEPGTRAKRAYDVAFFDVLDVVMARMRSTWDGYHNTFKGMANDEPPLFTLRDQDGDLVLTVHSPDVHIVVPSADELARYKR